MKWSDRIPQPELVFTVFAQATIPCKRLGSPLDPLRIPPMDPPVWTTARYPPLHDLTPLSKALLQFGLHLPLPACPFRTWVSTFTPCFSVFTRRHLFKRNKCRPHVAGRKRATAVSLENLFFQALALLCLKKLDSFWKPLQSCMISDA